MKTVLITGGSGMVGSALARHLTKKGYAVIVLTRKVKSLPVASAGNTLQTSTIEYALWDISKQTIDIAAVRRSDYIIHLAGAAVMDKKWTAAYKQEIQDSRTKSSELIVNTLKNNSNKVKAIVSASAIGWYGGEPPAHEDGFEEPDTANNNFLGQTCKLWEESIEPVIKLNIRLVKLRIGIVLSNEGGALEAFKKPIRFGVAAILGSGKQVISWVHIDDLCRLFINGLENEQLTGTYNAVAPVPVSNKGLVMQLARELKNSFFIPLHVPVFILKWLLGQRSIEVIKNAKVSCRKILQTGFTFLYPSIESALKQLAGK